MAVPGTAGPADRPGREHRRGESSRMLAASTAAGSPAPAKGTDAVATQAVEAPPVASRLLPHPEGLAGRRRGQ